jgi:hypothetical protein
MFSTEFGANFVTKECTLCRELKHLADFSKSTREKDGRRSRCKICTSLEKPKPTPESREKDRLQSAQRRKDNPDASRNATSRYRKNHPEKIAKYIEENISQVRATERRRYHKEREIRCDAHVEDWAKLRRDAGYYHFDINETRIKRNSDYQMKAESKCESHVKCWSIWNKATPDMRAERRRAMAKKIYDKESAKYCARSAYRRALRLKATSAWADKAKIEEFYFAADFLSMVTGEWHHVDHTIPLVSKVVCGLHNELNLQVLTAKENIAKSNKFEILPI